jgi:hypothetical protein
MEGMEAGALQGGVAEVVEFQLVKTGALHLQENSAQLGREL